MCMCMGGTSETCSLTLSFSWLMSPFGACKTGSKPSRRMPALLCESPHKENKNYFRNRPQLASRLRWGCCDLCVCVSWGE